MVTITSPSRETFLEGSRDLYRQAMLARQGGPHSAPEVVNVENALHLSEPEVLEYRGRAYTIEPISAVDGLRLMQLGADVEAMARGAGDGPGALGRFVSAYRRVVRELGRLARPSGWRGWLWRLRPNPFRRATLGEIQEILRFFGRYQTRSSVRYRGQEASDGRPRSTSRN